MGQALLPIVNGGRTDPPQVVTPLPAIMNPDGSNPYQGPIDITNPTATLNPDWTVNWGNQPITAFAASAGPGGSAPTGRQDYGSADGDLWDTGGRRFTRSTSDSRARLSRPVTRTRRG
jgi:hypothetical protein